MYDPARDSWQSSSDGPEQAIEEKRESDVLSEKEAASEVPPSVEPEPKVEPEKDGDSQNNNVNAESEKKGEPGPKPEPEKTEKSQDDANEANGAKNETIEDLAVKKASENNVHESEKDNRETSDAEPAPKKLKRPTRHVSKDEQERRAEELRQRMDRKDSEKADDRSSGADEQDSISTEDDRRIDLPSSLDPVRSHYNARPNFSREERGKSPIIYLKSFNNLIKSILINRNVRSRDTVLDIGCGKGGDLFKYKNRWITGLIGIDIADESVRQARQRYSEIRRKPFWADFQVGNPFSERVEDIVHPDAFPVNVVSIQFAMHYAFESEQNARTLLDNVSRVLRPGGRFIGTIPNSDVIQEHIAKLKPGEKEWGNSVYRVRFDDEPPKEFRPPFGHRYYFYLTDAVDNVPEYVVPFEAFRALAEEYRLRLLFHKPFLEMFDDELRDGRYTDLMGRMNVRTRNGNLGIEGEQREAAGFYCAFAMERM